MSQSEFALLGIGLILGVAAGVALVGILRKRPPRKREVRVTVAPDAVPRRRAATLANDAFTDSPVAIAPATGGPADTSGMGRDDGRSGSLTRTPVLAERAVSAVSRPSRPSWPDRPRVGVARKALPVSSGIDPMLSALRASAAASAEVAMQAAVARGESRHGSEAETARAVEGTTRAEPAAVATAPSDPPARAQGSGGPCGDARRLADERCELAARALAQASDAEDAHRAAQRAYDEHEREIVAATAAAEPRGVREAKDQAQARFRAARAGALTPEDIEAAAREWLQDINRINAGTAEAQGALAARRARLAELAGKLERVAIAADTARIAAGSAEAACLAARDALADCERRAASGLPNAGPAPNGGRGGEGEGADTLVAALRAGASPRIVRLLRGDRSAMHEIVGTLGGAVPEERRRWQIAIADLVDAILADAIAASALEFPTDHPFWGRFTREQCRDIAAALSSLGYRFDGLGGWADGRVPSQRDMSLALGYAGLDPMRMRHWPSEDEMSTLFSDVEVAAAEHLAGTAGDLTLGELITMLGRRADALAGIWNSWDRIRPLLLDEISG